MTLTEFLLARIAEDEAWARARQREDFRRHRVSAHRTHLAPDDPARVLADCEAKRAMVADYLTFKKVSEERTEETPLPQALTSAGIVTGMERAVARLAAIHADHPDYRDERKP